MPDNELVKKDQQALVNQPDVPMGFEDGDDQNMIIPRVKVIQSLSPERKDKIADEGDIINSLTKDKLNGQVFIPVFTFNNCILWKDRADGGGISCIARDGKRAETTDGQKLICASCKKCEFDNSKQGKDSFPKCTKYINFFGFFAGTQIPIILSFAKTNYNEGKRLYSLSKVTMQNMFNHKYRLDAKKMNKNGNEWYIIDVTPSGVSTEDERTYAIALYHMFFSRKTTLDFDVEQGQQAEETGPSQQDVDSAEM